MTLWMFATGLLAIAALRVRRNGTLLPELPMTSRCRCLEIPGMPKLRDDSGRSS